MKESSGLLLKTENKKVWIEHQFDLIYMHTILSHFF